MRGSIRCCSSRRNPDPRLMRLPVRSKRHLLAVLALGLLLAPGTWLRSVMPDRYSADVTFAPMPFDGRERGGLAVTGLWQLRGAGDNFGGYSAMVLYGTEAIRLFSDKGFLLTFPRPGVPHSDPIPIGSRQPYPTGIPLLDLLDIESATMSPETGQYWVGYEARHTIYRYGADGTPEANVEPVFARHWRKNGGIEALVRMRSGVFLAFRETAPDLFRYQGDPTQGAVPERFAVAWPGDFHPTDAGELPDGRVLVLLRKVAWHLPPFESLLVMIDPGQLDQARPLPVTILARIEDRLPRDNWEALAVEPGARTDQVGLWLASDDNRSVMQRSLLAQVRLSVPPRAAPQKQGQEQHGP